MKALKFYIDRKDIAEKLGIGAINFNKIAIGDVEDNFDNIEFTVFIDDSVELDASHMKDSNIDIRRSRLIN